MRHCAVCNTPITGCFGFVKAGDLLEYFAGVRPAPQIRELCGKCGFPPLFMNPRELALFLRNIGWA